MQGYIIAIQKQKSEDLIVRVLTASEIKTLYRFYGARHSIIGLGRKIDFTQEYNGIFMPKLRNVLHLGFAWERDINRLYVWQRFIGLFDRHLREIVSLEEQYFTIIDSMAHKLITQNPKRVALEAYAQILHLEGRSPLISRCLICEEHIASAPNVDILESLQLGYIDTHKRRAMIDKDNPQENALQSSCIIPKDLAVSVLHAFASAHTSCACGQILPYGKLESYLQTASTIDLDDDEVKRAYEVLLLGM